MTLFSWKTYWLTWGLIGHLAVVAALGVWLYPKRQVIVSKVRFALQETSAIPLDLKHAVNVWQRRHQTGALQAAQKADATRVISVSDVKELKVAIQQAQPGDRIELASGTYHLKGRSLAVKSPGSVDRPIVLASAKPWEAVLSMDMLEGLWVLAPYWQFTGLTLQGTCTNDSRCEHAFHIVGGAHHTVIKGNRISDFNAAVKINGDKGRNGSEAGVKQWPDFGVIEDNSFVNTRPRNTANPVTMIDAVGINHWRVENNLLANFKKAKGDRISTGGFFKGAGSDNLFSRNLVICSDLVSSEFMQVGLSLGNGGTLPAVCRDGRCDTEQSRSQISGNLVMNCSDVGVYLNRAQESLIANNTLYNTLGIDVRFPESQAIVVNNLFNGRIKERDGGTLQLEEHNWELSLQSRFLDDFSEWFQSPHTLDFSSIKAPSQYPSGIYNENLPTDLCGNRQDSTRPVIGALDMTQNANCLAIQ